MQSVKPLGGIASLLVAKTSSDGSLWLPIWVHSLDTLGVMRYLFTEWLPNSELSILESELSHDAVYELASILAVTHDIGKVSILFQSKIGQNCKIRKDKLTEQGLFVPDVVDEDLHDANLFGHAVAGETWLLMKGWPLSVAAVIGSHHGTPWIEGVTLANDLMDCEPASLESPAIRMYASRLCGNMERRKKWLPVWNEMYQWMIAQVESPKIESFPNISEKTAVLLTGLLIMADWIASNTYYFPLIRCDEDTPKNMESRLKNGLNRLNLPCAWNPISLPDTNKHFYDRFGFAPNEVQSTVADAIMQSESMGLMILEAPMGVGKTEAALFAAEQLGQTRVGGLFFGLPTQATANGIFDRVVDWGKGQTKENQASIRLAHGMALLNEHYRALISGNQPSIEEDKADQSGLIVHDWFQGNKQALLADFVVGTVDQLLMASLKQRHVMLRHLGLCGKAVIIDECHAYDAYMNQYLDRTLSWLGYYHTPVLMLSATLPYARRAALVDAYLNRPEHKNHNKDKPEEQWRHSSAYPLLTWTDGRDVKQIEIEYKGLNKKIQMHRISCENQREVQAEKTAEILRKR